MLVEILEKAVSVGGSSVEIEYRDGKENITLFRGDIGYGIASLAGEEAKSLFKEMDDLRKEKRAALGGVMYRLVFSRYESFGEWVYRIRMKQANDAAASKRQRRTHSA